LLYEAIIATSSRRTPFKTINKKENDKKIMQFTPILNANFKE